MALFAQHFFAKQKSMPLPADLYFADSMYYTGEVKIIRMFFFVINQAGKEYSNPCTLSGKLRIKFLVPIEPDLEIWPKNCLKSYFSKL